MRNLHIIQARGFSLIELMVAMVVGLIATLVISNVLVTYESQKRTTVGVGDAQVNGAVALYQVQRDAQSAGYGLPVYGNQLAMNCPINTKITIDPDKNPATNNDISLGLSAIEVLDGGAGAGNSDTLRIQMGTTSTGGVPTQITVGVNTVATVDNNLGCAKDNVALLMSGDIAAPSCKLSKVTAVSSGGTPTITLDNNTLVGNGSQISCLGDWNQIKYAINAATNQLERNDVPVMAGVVNMQVQYGISASGNDNTIAQYVNPTGAWDSTAITLVNRNRIKAIRIAIVARSTEIAKTDVTVACATNPNGPCAWTDANSAPPLINLSGIANWKRYRYRVYETIIPLKNVIYSKANMS